MPSSPPWLVSIRRKAGYAGMRIALAAGYALAWMLSLAGPLLRRGPSRGDLALFPYQGEASPGFRIRFEWLLPRLARDGIRHRLFSPGGVDPAAYGGRMDEYWLYYGEHVRLFYRRLGQVLAARRYRSVWVQRGLFPSYPDQERAHLGRLLRALAGRVAVDFYDADYVSNPRIVESTVRYADKLTVVNTHLENHFRTLHPRVFVFPLAIDVAPYPVKSDYTLGDRVRIFWWGSVGNTAGLNQILPSLRAFAERVPSTLVVVCAEPVSLPGLEVEWHRWNPATVFELLRAADVAVSPVIDNERSRGGMAMKVLEYMAAAVPVVASPFALSPHARDQENILIARDESEWTAALRRLAEDRALRERLGRGGRAMLEQHHAPEDSYRRLISILLEDATTSAHSPATRT